MTTNRLAIAAFLFLATIGTMASPDLAQADSFLYRMELTAEEIIPEWPRRMNVLKKQAGRIDAAYKHAHKYGDTQEMARFQRTWKALEREYLTLKGHLVALGTTTVTMYGDATTQVSRAQLVELLRKNTKRIGGPLHMWKKSGKLMWDSAAPPNGYDITRSAPSDNRPVKLTPPPQANPFGW